MLFTDYGVFGLGPARLALDREKTPLILIVSSQRVSHSFLRNPFFEILLSPRISQGRGRQLYQ